MAVLEHMDSGETFVPLARCVLGRARSASLVVDDPQVSGEHAALIWTDAGWMVRDLGSRNGTWVGERRLSPGEQVPIGVEDVLHLGGGDARWVLVDDAPPEAPAALPPTVEHGRASARIADLRLRVAVSGDEEYVEVEVIGPRGSSVLAPRAYHDLFLVLARERLRDRTEGASPREEGWLYFQDLCRMIGRKRSQVNVEIHRARQQFVELGIADAAKVFERRAPTHQIRLGVADLSVESL